MRPHHQGQNQALEESLPGTVQELYHKVEEKTDPFVSQNALREVLLAVRERQARLVLALDPFAPFCQVATTQVLDNLRGLRDSFKTTLSYIVGLRHELAYVRDPIELGELYEILDTHVCWLGPMQADDARWVIHQVEQGMNRSFDDAQVEGLIDLTGGYPALLRAASLWLAQVSPVPDMATWEKHLVAGAAILSSAGGELRYLSGKPVDYEQLLDGQLAPEPIIAGHPDLLAGLRDRIRPRSTNG